MMRSSSRNRRSFGAVVLAAFGAVVLVTPSGSRAQPVAGRLVWQRTAITPGTPVPPARLDAATTYDERRQRVVLFGGDGTNAILGDLWEFDGAQWVQRTPATSSTPWPVRRFGASMAYDASRGRVVLYGGFGVFLHCDPGGFCRYSLEYAKDTWEWDGINWYGQVAGPAQRSYAPILYDATRQRVVLFGGVGDVGPPFGLYYFDETWEWNGVRWTRFLPIPRPPARSSAMLIPDPARGSVILVGGGVTGIATLYPLVVGYERPMPAFAETWEWKSAKWSLRTPTTAPFPRSHAGSAWGWGSAFIYGGSNSALLIDDLWEWDGTNWYDRTPAGDTPGFRDGHSMVFDTAGDRFLVFGGCGQQCPSADMWELIRVFD